LLSFLSLAIIIAVSQRASSVIDAQQTAMLLVMPLIAVMIAQFAGFVYLDVLYISVGGLVVLVIDIIAYRWITKNLNREQIVTKFA